MESILSSVAASQGVMGGLIMDDAGRILVQSLPEMFDPSQVATATAALAEQQIGLEEGTGGVRLAELRFELGKVISRPVGERSIVLICDHAVNLQMLLIALNVASKKLEKMPVTQADAFTPVNRPKELTPPSHSGTGWTFMPLPVENGKQLLRVAILEKTGGTFWESMEEHISVNRPTCRSIWRHYSSNPSKKFILTNPKTGASSNIRLQVIENDKENQFDGVVLMTLAAAEHLGVKEGEQVYVEVPKGTGIFGWEGI